MKKKFILLFFSLLQIICTFSQTRDDFFELLEFINADSIQRTVLDLQAFETRRADRPPKGNFEVAQYLVSRLQEYGIENAHIDSFDYKNSLGDYIGYNVLGTFPGELSDSTVIVGAHLDCYNSNNFELLAAAPGADDNATGCAQTIEMARIFFQKKFKPRHNVDFMAYDFEEFGLRGARYDAFKRWEANEKIVVMLNNDMVGFQPEDKDWILSLYWYDNALDVSDKAIEFCRKYTKIIPFKPDSANNLSMRSRSDSYAYFERDFKANFNIEYTFSPFYHQDRDSAVYLNFEYQKQVAHLNLALLCYYSKAPFNLMVKNYTLPSIITVAPNPATDLVYLIHGDDVNVLEIHIYDMIGRIMASYSNIETQQTILNIQNYNSGVYFVKIITNNGVVTKKLIKQ